MVEFGQDVTVTDTLPAWNEPSCTRRWDGETQVFAGQRGVVIEPFPRLDEPEFDSEWWIVRVGSVYAPCEIHSHLDFA